jgi:DNA processing protein
MLSYPEWLERLAPEEHKFAPKTLYIEGDSSLLFSGRKVAVVGTRQPTAEGIKRTQAVVQLLVEREITVVSGLALGVDTVAHTEAIRLGGRTIAVLPTHLDACSPKSNEHLLNEIKANHLAVSQFGPDSTLNKGDFIRRNRTMALLTDATIIIEASESSGTKHQAWEAVRLNRMLLMLESLVSAPGLDWPKKLMDYGGQVLTRENASELLDSIPFPIFDGEYGF